MLKFLASQFIKLKKEKENFALVLVALFIVLMIVLIVKVFTSIFPDYINFDPDTYGTVSDWVIVFATIVTAVFVYKTLQSQMEVQRDQAQINRLTSFDIRAKYKAEITVENPQPFPLAPFKFQYLDVTINDNDALDIRISSTAKFEVENFKSSYKTTDKKNIAYISRIKKGEIIRLKIDEKVLETLSYLNEQDKINTFKKLIKLKIDYFDNFEFKYSKTFIFSYNNYTHTLLKRDSNTVFF